MSKTYFFVDNMWKARDGSTVNSVITPPVVSEPDPAPTGWQESIDLAVAQQDWTPVISWYAAHTGHEALGYNEADLVYVGTIASVADGQVIEGLRGERLRIAHNNVTVRGCRITGGGIYGAYYNPTFGSNYINNVVEYCTFDDSSGSDTNAILFLSGEGSPTLNLTLRNNNCTGFSQGIRTRGNVLAEYNWMHDFSHPPGSHSNAYRHVGNTNCIARRNYGSDGSSGTMSIYFDKEPTANIEYSENIMSGQSTPEGAGGPSYLVNLKDGMYDASASNIKLVNNMWGPGYQYGVFSGSTGLTWNTNGNERSGNHDLMTGQLIGNA